MSLPNDGSRCEYRRNELLHLSSSAQDDMEVRLAGMSVGRHSPGPSPSPKQLLDIGQLHLDEGRAAVVALAGVGGGFHFAQ